MVFYLVGPIPGVVNGMSWKEPYIALLVALLWGVYGVIYFTMQQENRQVHCHHDRPHRRGRRLIAYCGLMWTRTTAAQGNAERRTLIAEEPGICPFRQSEFGIRHPPWAAVFAFPILVFHFPTRGFPANFPGSGV